MRRAALPVAALALIASAGLHEAQAQSRTRVGALTCSVSGGIGLIVTSQKTTVCTFDPRRGRNERYVGVIRRFGLDLGVTGRGVLAWGGLLREAALRRARWPAAMSGPQPRRPSARALEPMFWSAVPTDRCPTAAFRQRADRFELRPRRQRFRVASRAIIL